MSNQAKLALGTAKAMQKEILQWDQSLDDTTRVDADVWVPNNEIYKALLQISDALANSYAQIKGDLRDTKRLSWAGTAHEVREVIATMLRELAPDTEVRSQPWYRQEPDASGPTQKQRARHILQKQGKGSKAVDVAEQIGDMDEMIQNLVRSTYTRASAAAHSFETKDEVQQILRYFETFAQDILGLP